MNKSAERRIDSGSRYYNCAHLCHTRAKHGTNEFDIAYFRQSARSNMLLLASAVRI